MVVIERVYFQCGDCKRIYCDIVSKSCANVIKQMLNGDLKGDKAHEYLANKFHGIGFERNVSYEPF